MNRLALGKCWIRCSIWTLTVSAVRWKKPTALRLKGRWIPSCRPTPFTSSARAARRLGAFLDYYFRLMFPTVKLVDAASTGEVFEQIMRIDEHDVIIGFSFPRYSKRTSSALHFAKQNGAKVIAITDSISSPLVRSADYFLQARSDMASFVDSMVAPLSLINALIVAIGLKKQDEMKKTFDRLEQIWDAYDVFDKSGGTNG